jgi:hypothetical protein
VGSDGTEAEVRMTSPLKHQGEKYMQRRELLDDPGMKGTIEYLKKWAASCRELVKAMAGHSAK